VVILDYLQQAALNQGYAEIRANVTALADKLSDLERRLRCPVLAISSQNRAADYDKGGSSALTSLKETGNLKYCACDGALFLQPSSGPPAIEPARAINLTVSKQRHGPLGVVRLIFRAHTGEFREEA
jgi:replicative DNA helicase